MDAPSAPKIQIRETNEAADLFAKHESDSQNYIVVFY